MTFDDKYAALKERFRQQVDIDQRDFNVASEFVTNIAPKGEVDHVLIGTEPSTGGNTKGYRSPKNFSSSLEDFILHFCAHRYLCSPGETYYLTDLSKGGMAVSKAKDNRMERYERWYDLLIQELNLVAPKASVIAIDSTARQFLDSKKLPRLKGLIPHYSGSASGNRIWLPAAYPEEYAAFAQQVSVDDIEQTVKRVAQEANMPSDFVDGTLQNLAGKQMTESRKMLMFSYKTLFAVVRKQIRLR